MENNQLKENMFGAVNTIVKYLPILAGLISIFLGIEGLPTCINLFGYSEILGDYIFNLYIMTINDALLIILGLYLLTRRKNFILFGIAMLIATTNIVGIISNISFIYDALIFGFLAISILLNGIFKIDKLKKLVNYLGTFPLIIFLIHVLTFTDFHYLYVLEFIFWVIMAICIYRPKEIKIWNNYMQDNTMYTEVPSVKINDNFSKNKK